jgi:hypothetical protein
LDVGRFDGGDCRFVRKTNRSQICLSARSLALGDTDMWVSRVGILTGRLEQTVSVFGQQVGLVGLGALSTALGDLVYVLMLMVGSVATANRMVGSVSALAATECVRADAVSAKRLESSVPPQPMVADTQCAADVVGLGVSI